MTPDLPQPSHEQENNHFVLTRRVNGLCWAGPDITSPIDHFIPADPDTSYDIPLIIPTSALPDMTDCTPRAIQFFPWSVRSRLAQLGLHMEDILIEDVAENWLKFQRGLAPFNAHAHVKNLSARPIYIPKDTGIFRFFTGTQLTKRLEGPSLLQAMEHGAIQITGLNTHGTNIEPPFHWLYAANKPFAQANIIGIQIPLLPEWHHYIPAGENPANIDHHLKEFHEVRGSITDLLKPIPDIVHAPNILWIGRTPKIKLGKVAGILLERPTNGSDIGVNIDQQGHLHLRSLHISSHFIEPLRTDGEVVVEIYGPPHSPLRPDYVAMYFVPAA